MQPLSKKILTINSGSSSIKFSLYSIGKGNEEEILSGKLERIGLERGNFTAVAPDGRALTYEDMELPGHEEALKRFFSWLFEMPEGKSISAIGHRIVHGGAVYTSPHRVDAKLMAELERLKPFAPEHLPHEIKAINAVATAFPSLPQFACFDTAFHSTMPEAARTFPIPLALRDEGIVRYGFHGLSYEYIVSEMKKIESGAGGRMVIAHLGNGVSMAAVKDGACVDTTMGFTPTGGLMMSTRSGDLDPGLIVYLLKEKGLGADEVNVLLNKKSGLLGVSGISPAMEDLIGNTDKRAKLAVELFCYQARKFIASLATTLGGLDTIVFTAGIGENSPVVRERICTGLEFMGVKIDADRNARNTAIVSNSGVPVTVRVLMTNEELIIARHAARFMEGG